MTNAPLMPMATAVWLVENTTLTFKQIADFCQMHEVEIQGIADGEVAKGIKAYNPIISGQLSREEIEMSSKDQNRPLEIKSSDIEISNVEKKRRFDELKERENGKVCLKIFITVLGLEGILLLLFPIIIWLLLQGGLIHQKLESLLRKLLILKLIKINKSPLSLGGFYFAS